MKLFKLTALALLATLSIPAVSQAPIPALGPPTAEIRAAPPAPAVPAGGATLNRADVEAWLDGFMPFALARGDIAGGVVVVVKDGQVLLQKGYGYSDVARRTPVSADATLFRPGSVSKLITWTAVMQLVEQGRLDLDRDVNQYLDFKIPPYRGQPITLRQIMTHTAGFQESSRHLISNNSDAIPMDRLVKMSLPERIFAPGTTPAYSNYATMLAGYIVQRVSGMSFDDYVDRRVFAPIGMTRSTFRQPLPASLAPMMSKGYPQASQDAKPFETVEPAPAGSMSATGADMAKFMIAHLAQGRGLLRPGTARLMHTPQAAAVPPLDTMALGFYRQDLNGRRVIAHGGDTQFFHSNLQLFLDENVGLFVSVNSGGANGASGPLRSALSQQFAARYFPAPRITARVDPATARKHAQMMAGTYSNSRGFETNFLRILDLFGQPKLGVDKDGALVAGDVTGLANQPRKWIEVAPFVWRDPASGERIAAKLTDGRVMRWSFEPVSPFMVFDRVPWHLDGAWLMPAFFIALVIILLTALAWPVRALARRQYKATVPYAGRRLGVYRSIHGLAWLAILTLAGWFTWVTMAFGDLSLLAGGLDWLLYLVQFLSAVVFVGLFGFALWNAWLAFTEKRRWTSKLWAVLLLFAALILLWVALGFHLIGFGTRY